jgi:hypothetical protein
LLEALIQLSAIAGEAINRVTTNKKHVARIFLSPCLKTRQVPAKRLISTVVSAWAPYDDGGDRRPGYDTQAGAAAALSKPPHVGWGGTKMALVLVVDDEADVRQLLGRVIRHEGHEVMEASRPMPPLP